MKTRSLLATLPLMASLSGCAFLYDLGQDRALDRCAQLVDASDRGACLRANGQSYETYEDKRKKAKQGNSQS